MSASPTRLEYLEPSAPGSGFPLQEGNRVLECLAEQKTVPALLAFSVLHEQIRERRAWDGLETDLFQTERFVLNEVLQLICDRVQAITAADGVMIALVEGPGVVCYAASGPLLVERGFRLEESEFLQDCLESGRVLRCDDCLVDTRVEFDLSRALEARATVLVPLRGRNSRLGVLQAFSRTPFALGDDDVRCLELFAELILSSLKPEDDDRRVNWLADVAGEILNPKPVAPPVTEKDAAPKPASIAPVERATPAPLNPVPFAAVTPVALPETYQKIPAPAFALESLQPRGEKFRLNVWAHLAAPVSSRPGLSFVLVLVMVAGLFATGVWWGMYNREAAPEISAARQTLPAQPAHSASAPAASDHLLDPATNAGAPANASQAPELATLPKVTGLRHWSSAVGSTVVIDLDDQVQYEVHRLASPERIYFDLHDTALVPELQGKTIEIGDPLLTRLRVAQPAAGTTRVVLDTRDGSNFAVSMESNPSRIVVQLRGTERSADSRRIDAGAPAPQGRQNALSVLPAAPGDEQLRAKVGQFRIVLDAGHGGWDLGTVGREGLLEKNLVLDVTERLGRLLKSRLGADVIYTRTSDAYLPLDQRAEIANDAQADVFVSVHANYSTLATARGVETYYANFFSAPGSREIEKRENGSGPQPTPVSLSAGELHEKIDESHRLAASVQHALYGKLAASSPGIRNRGIKDAAFVVLTGTRMPSILTEISFVSSPTDEEKLQSEAYRQQIAEALYKGIAQYEAAAHHDKLAQMQQASAQR